MPPTIPGLQRMCSDGFGSKKKPFGFNFSNLRTVTEVLVSLNGAEGRTRQSIQALDFK